MSTFLIAVASFVGFIVAYRTYGRWLATSIFNLDPSAAVPSEQLRDDVDFVPSKRSLVFGHHFTSIAGTGPIVGPAIAVFWGWLPALLWVVFGSIFIGAVHDFGALVVSLRNRGQTVGEIAGRLISPRAKLLFLITLFFALTIVLAIFGLVIAAIFLKYPESVLGVWISLPLAILVGFISRKNPAALIGAAIVSLVVVYASVYIGAYYLPIQLPVSNPIVGWTIILLIYCAIASVMPVWVLLQPRDFINSWQLFIALGLLVIGLAVASFSGQANLFDSTPAMAAEMPAGSPPIWPFLFITIACGAISGFHCLVSSGTSSKQICNECDSQMIGYGSMLLEGALAVVVILACCAGIGMGKFEKTTAKAGAATMATSWQPVVDANQQPLRGRAAWRSHYSVDRPWKNFSLGDKVGAFVEGSANFLAAIYIPRTLGIGIMAVLVACFAATTLDSATRLQRYVVQELATTVGLKPLTNKYSATFTAVLLGGLIAMIPNADGQIGKGGLLLWPLFGATNQLLAGLAFMVTAFYLWRRGKPVWFIVLPTVVMMVMPAWAMSLQLFAPESGWFWSLGDNLLLATIGMATLGLQLWMAVEAVLLWPSVRGVLEEALPPLPSKENLTPSLDSSGGQS
jgi:carbon starvation protein